MSDSERTGAVAFSCDVRGEIHEVLRDDFGLPERVRPGKPVMASVDEAHLMEVMSALRALMERGEFSGLRLTVPLPDDDAVELDFAGARGSDGLFVVAGATSAVLLDQALRAADDPESRSGVEEARDAVDDVAALARGIVASHDEVRRLRSQVAARLAATARDLEHLGRVVRDGEVEWTAALRSDVADALSACGRLLSELSEE